METSKLITSTRITSQERLPVSRWVEVDYITQSTSQERLPGLRWVEVDYINANNVTGEAAGFKVGSS